MIFCRQRSALPLRHEQQLVSAWMISRSIIDTPAALQPIVGLWVASILFVLVHIRAYRWDQLNKRVLLQFVSVLAIGICLGLVATYVGLLAAIIVHAAMDALGLYVVRRMTSAAAPVAG